MVLQKTVSVKRLSILCGPMRYNVGEAKGGSGMTDFFETLSPAEKDTGGSIPEETVRLIAERWECDERVLAVYLLGSAARGTMRPDSDIDIGVLPAPGEFFSALELAEISAEISFETGYVVDAGLVDGTDLVYANQALDGVRLFVREGTTTELREAALRAMYLRFCEDRKEVVDAYS